MDMIKLFDRFEKVVSAILLGFGIVLITFQVVQLIWNTIGSFAKRFQQAGLEYAPEYTRTIAILFFNILLMLEILQTIKIFSQDHVVKVRIILIVCLIAVSRKILALGEQSTEPLADLALAALVLALSAGYFLVSRHTIQPVEEKKGTDKVSENVKS
jgi:uncharacterized membrane protein (DUF373 family)